ALNGRAALIVGKKGAGKSMTTLACLSAGLGYLGDDKVLVEACETPRVYSVFASAKLSLKDLPKLSLPGLANRVHFPVTKDDTKGLIYLNEIAPDQMVAKAHLASIIQPHPTGGISSEIVPLNSAAALRSLIPELVGHYPSSASQSFEVLRNLVREVPCYRLHAGRDLNGVAASIADHLSHFTPRVRCAAHN